MSSLSFKRLVGGLLLVFTYRLMSLCLTHNKRKGEWFIFLVFWFRSVQSNEISL